MFKKFWGYLVQAGAVLAGLGALIDWIGRIDIVKATLPKLAAAMNWVPNDWPMWVTPVAFLVFGVWWQVLSRKRDGQPGALVAPAPTFTITVDRTPAAEVAERGIERFLTVKVRNNSAQTLTDCLVQIEEISGYHPAGASLSLPLVIRTEGQLRGARTGRFILSAGQTKNIPVLYRRRNRRNERFVFDEGGIAYGLTDNAFRIVVCIYGGNSSARTDIEIEAFFVSHQTFVPDSTIRELCEYMRPDIRPDTPDIWDEVEHELLDKLSTGQLFMWGRPIRGSGHRPLELIPQDYWPNAHFTFMFLADGHDQDRHVDGPINREKYADLRVSRAQMVNIWPK